MVFFLGLDINIESPMFFIIAKFSPNDLTKARGLSDPMAIYSDWPSAEAAAIAAQEQTRDGSSFAVFQAVAVTAFVSPPVTVNLLGATVPTTV